MPSGFQNDTNQLQAEMYRVVVTMSNTTFYPTADGNNNGGITPSSWDSFTSPPTTLVLGQARARGNMRFRNIVNALTGLSDCQIRDITITEANANAQATSLAFTVNFERPGFIPLTGARQGALTVGNDIANAAMDTTAKVIANEVAKAIRSTTTATMRVYDPTGADGNQQSITVTHTGATASETLGTVAVSLIDESTLID
jgi:uncharacterized protein YjiS (DUF1127 family)